MKKVIFTISLFVFSIGIIHANLTNFNTRISDGSSYLTGTSFMDGPISVSTGVSLDFETIIQTKAGSGINTYSINLPTGFQYQTPHSINIAQGTGICNPTGIESLDNLFRFTIPNVDCIIELYTKYKVLSSGNHNVTLLGNNGTSTTLLNTININVSGNNTILSASTLDQNNDGIIDGYLINTIQPADINSLSGILIGGNSPNTITQSGANTSWIFSFSGGTFGTSSLPQISGNFGGNIITNENIIENDNTPPVINNSILSGTYSSSQTVILSNLSESGTIYYSTSGIATTSSTIYTTPIIINSPLTLSVLVVDMYNNSRTYIYTYSFACAGTPPTGTYFSTYPTCNITCTSGSWDGSKCVTTGGGSSGPTIDFCPTGDLSGNSYDAKCEASITNTGTISSTGNLISTGSEISTGTTSDINYQNITPIGDLGMSTLDKTFFENIDSGVKYLYGNITNSKVLALINSLLKKLSFDGIDYYITYDFDFVREYNKTLNSFVLFAIKLNNYFNGEKTSENKTNIIALYKNIISGIEKIKEESFIEKIWFNDIDNSFAKKDIIYLALKGVIKGYNDQTFKPDNRITRAEFLGMVMKTFLVQVDESIIKTDFSDIPKDGVWMMKYIVKASDYGIKGQEIQVNNKSSKNITIGEKYPEIVSIEYLSNNPSVVYLQELLIENGYDIINTGIFDEQTVISLNKFILDKTGANFTTTNLGTIKLSLLKSIQIPEPKISGIKKIFRPNEPISRAEALAILFNIAGINIEENNLSDFSDIPSDGVWMIKYIQKARELGVANGQTIDGQLKFRPNDGITRAETTRIITKTLFLGKYN